jgi:hypothetical protein
MRWVALLLVLSSESPPGFAVNDPLPLVGDVDPGAVRLASGEVRVAPGLVRRAPASGSGSGSSAVLADTLEGEDFAGAFAAGASPPPVGFPLPLGVVVALLVPTGLALEDDLAGGGLLYAGFPLPEGWELLPELAWKEQPAARPATATVARA